MSALKQDTDRLMNQARVKLPGSSDAGIKGELFEVFHEFFNDSSSWTENVPVSILVGTTTYSVAPGEGGTIIRLAGVVDATGLPQPAILNDRFNGITFSHAYNNVQTFTATLVKNVVLPTQKDCIPEVPEWVLPVFGPTILHGLLGKMMGQLSKSYSNDPLSVYHTKKFRDGIAMARTASLRRNTFGTQAWTFPQGFRTRNQRGGVSVGSQTGFGL